MKISKKGLGLTEATIIGVVLLLAGAAIASQGMNKFYSTLDKEKKDKSCAASVRIREQANIDIEVKGPALDIHANRFTPLLCDPVKYEKFPEKGDATRENVERGLAELMTKCWYKFGEGAIDDVFKGTAFDGEKCSPCYYVTIKDSEEFSNDKPMAGNELLEYMWKNEKDIYARNDQCYNLGGQCIPATCECGGNSCPEDKKFNDKPYNSNLKTLRATGVCKSKKGDDGKDVPFICCTSKNPCENKGGKCMDKCDDKEGDDKYDFLLDKKGYECKDKKTQCCIRSKDKFSYLDYIQSYNGQGVVAVLSNIEPGKTYAILYGSPTGTDCGKLCNVLGIGAGTAATIGGVAMALKLGATAGALIAGGPVTWIIVGVGVAAGYGIYRVSEEAVEVTDLMIKDLVGARAISTVYLVDLEVLSSGEDNICNIAEDT